MYLVRPPDSKFMCSDWEDFAVRTGAVSSGMFDPRDVCARHGLTLLEDLSDRGSTSTLVLHVRDLEGAEHVLKQARPEDGATELTALRAWTRSGVTPRLTSELEAGLWLLEWIQGRSMAEIPLSETVASDEIGQALADLHRTSPSTEIPDIGSSFVLEPADAWKRLPQSMYLLAGRLATVLRHHDTDAPVLLHADLVPANVMLTRHEPKFIDPVGRRGLAAWDVAQLAAAAEGWGRRGILAPLLQGYGRIPRLIAEAFAWMLLFYLQKNLAVPDSPFTQHLLPVVTTLDAVGNAEKFLQGYLGRDWSAPREPWGNA